MKFNEKAISGLYHASKPARVLLNELSALPRQTETLMSEIEDRLKGNEEVSRRDIVTFFKQLDDYGAGEFIPGRRGHPSRFRWEVDSVNVSTLEVAFPKHKDANHNGNNHEAHNIPSPFSSIPAQTAPVVLISHRYQLRPELAVMLQLPTDISAKEAERLCQFVHSLPFGGQN